MTVQEETAAGADAELVVTLQLDKVAAVIKNLYENLIPMVEPAVMA